MHVTSGVRPARLEIDRRQQCQLLLADLAGRRRRRARPRDVGMGEHGRAVARAQCLASARRHEPDVGPFAAHGLRQRRPGRAAERRQRRQLLEVEERAAAVDARMELTGAMIVGGRVQHAVHVSAPGERHDVTRPRLERQVGPREHHRPEREHSVDTADADLTDLPPDPGVGVDQQRLTLDTALLHGQCTRRERGAERGRHPRSPVEHDPDPAAREHHIQRSCRRSAGTTAGVDRRATPRSARSSRTPTPARPCACAPLPAAARREPRTRGGFAGR